MLLALPDFRPRVFPVKIPIHRHSQAYVSRTKGPRFDEKDTRQLYLGEERKTNWPVCGWSRREEGTSGRDGQHLRKGKRKEREKAIRARSERHGKYPAESSNRKRCTRIEPHPLPSVSFAKNDGGSASLHPRPSSSLSFVLSSFPASSCRLSPIFLHGQSNKA